MVRVRLGGGLLLGLPGGSNLLQAARQLIVDLYEE